MTIIFEKVPEEENETMVRVMLDGKSEGVVWRQKTRVFNSHGLPTPRFSNRWFARREGAEESDIIGKGMARATSRKGDGYFDRLQAIEALLEKEEDGDAP